MSEQFNWKFTIQVVGGPTMAASGEQVIDAYSKSQIKVPAHSGGTDGEVVLALNTTGASILAIRASQYIDPNNTTNSLQYAITSGGVVGTAAKMTGPIIMIGESSIRLLGNPVEMVTFTNPIESEITIDTLVGRDATSTP